MSEKNVEELRESIRGIIIGDAEYDYLDKPWKEYSCISCPKDCPVRKGSIGCARLIEVYEQMKNNGEK